MAQHPKVVDPTPKKNNTKRTVIIVVIVLIVLAIIIPGTFTVLQSRYSKTHNPTPDAKVMLNLDDARTAMIADVNTAQALIGGSDWMEVASPTIPNGCANDNDGNTTGASFQLQRTRTDKTSNPEAMNAQVLAAWKAKGYTIDTQNHFSPTQYALFATTPEGLGIHFENDTGVIIVDGTTNCVAISDFRAEQQKYLDMAPGN